MAEKFLDYEGLQYYDSKIKEYVESGLANYVTTNTAQTISEKKTFSNGAYFGAADSANNDKGIIFEYGSPAKSSKMGMNTQGDLGIYSYKDIHLRPGLANGSTYGVRMTTAATYPTTDRSMAIGAIDRRFNNLYLTGNISDGTNSIPVANIPTKSYVQSLDERISALEFIQNYVPALVEEQYPKLKNAILPATRTINNVTYSMADNARTMWAKVLGRTKQFNQLVKNGNFVDTSVWLTNQGTLTVSSNEGDFISKASNGYSYLSQKIRIIKGHKYLKIGEFKFLETPTGSVWFRLRYGTGDYNDSYLDTTSTSWQKISSIVTATADLAENYETLMLRDNSTSNWVHIKIRNVMLIDLTAMGLDSITTVEEFTALYPNAYYAYNAGTLYDSVVSGVSLTGRNLWDEEWEVGTIDNNGNKLWANDRIRSKNYIKIKPSIQYYVKSNTSFNVFYYDINETFISSTGWVTSNIRTTPTNCYYIKFITTGTTYNNDICINISDPSFNGKYEPYHLSTISLPSTQTLGGVGTTQDEIQVTKNENDEYYTIKKIQRVASVDLGTLDWALTSAGNNKYGSVGITNYLRTQTVRALCSKYQFGGTVNGSAASMDDKKFYFYYNANNTSVYQYIRDTSFSTAEALKTSLSGVILTYELATPVETIITSTATREDVSALRFNNGLISVVGNTNGDYTQPDINMIAVYKKA